MCYTQIPFTKELSRSAVMKTKKSKKNTVTSRKIQLLFGKKSSIAYCRSDWFTLNMIVLELQILDIQQVNRLTKEIQREVICSGVKIVKRHFVLSMRAVTVAALERLSNIKAKYN